MMPQEVEVWYVLPAVRRELAKVMKTKLVDRVGEDGRLRKHKITQKEIAKMLGVTEPAITQYLLKKGKRSRGDQVEIPAMMQAEIDKAADEIIAAFEASSPPPKVYETMTREINRILRVMRDEGIMCDIHKQFSVHVGDTCDACKNK
jgi:predicted transcriptional regulator